MTVYVQLSACLYGDKATFCTDIEAHNCYQTNTEVLCCDTCPTFYQDNYPEGIYVYAKIIKALKALVWHLSREPM